MSENGDVTSDRSEPEGRDVFEDLFDVIEQRRRERPADSYTASLFGHEKGVDAMLEKLGEETTEVLLAAKNDEADELTEEAADLMYHLFVVLAARGISLEDLRAALRERRG